MRRRARNRAWVWLSSLALVLPAGAWLEARDDAAREATAVKDVVSAAARALASFPNTRDVQSVLAYYDPDYTLIEDGEQSSTEGTRELLDDLQAELNRGRRVNVGCNVSRIKVRVAGPVAWATYDWALTIRIGGKLRHDEAGLCTAVLVKEQPGWRFAHEHCSSADDAPEADEEDDDPLLPLDRA
ncbi:MAG TPA: nuclear transport factor 2 family protein [Candidatus Polarisedimenticolaceae bacterium]|nr:nuclear transport factor 2 family protein [Candidatus Polarisedimenticolaceae bacterium]